MPIFSLPDNKIKSLVFGFVIAVSYLKRAPCGIWTRDPEIKSPMR
jgi:hypothetical protein